jgi:hypothetical protein
MRRRKRRWASGILAGLAGEVLGTKTTPVCSYTMGKFWGYEKVGESFKALLEA